jgi:hypothetical protein
MPPPGVTGSKRAKVKPLTALGTCNAPAGAALVERLKLAQSSCAAMGKMKPASAIVQGRQSDKDKPAEHRLRVDPNKCYRVLFVADESVTDAVVVMRDSALDIVGESATGSLPEDGTACFASADEISLMVGVGGGQGAYALQLWSE